MQLHISARFVSFYCSQRTQFDAAGCSSSTPSDDLETWVRYLAPLLSESGLRKLAITTHSLSRYCCQSGRLRSLASNSQQLEARSLGLHAGLSWPVPGRPPSFFFLTLTAL